MQKVLICTRPNPVALLCSPPLLKSSTCLRMHRHLQTAPHAALFIQMSSCLGA